MPQILSRADLKQSGFAFFLFKPFSNRRLLPSSSGKFIKRDSTPAQTCIRRRVATLDAHVHEDFVTTLELTNLSERHVV